MSGALQPGEKIIEEQLCADLGISRAPLREALRQLAQQGLVEHLPRRGSRVAEWSPQDIMQLFELRAVLERHAIEYALPLPDPDSALQPVHTALAQMRDADTDLERDDAHREFHAAVVALAGNRQLDIALEPILLKLQLPMAVNLREEARAHHADDGIERHEAILEALSTNDAAVVLAAMHDHGHLSYLRL
jgi:DNA-binding GntR family transcriptional regulator